MLDVTLSHNMGTVQASFGVDAAVQMTEVFHKALGQAAVILKAEVVRGYSGVGRPGWANLHWFTIARKGHAEPLYHTGAMMDAVEIVPGETDVAVGINDPEQARKALIQERGAILRVTPAMRGFLASRGFRLLGSTQFLVIPARPNFANSLGAVLPEITALFMQAISDFYTKGGDRGAA